MHTPTVLKNCSLEANTASPWKSASVLQQLLRPCSPVSWILSSSSSSFFPAGLSGSPERAARLQHFWCLPRLPNPQLSSASSSSQAPPSLPPKYLIAFSPFPGLLASGPITSTGLLHQPLPDTPHVHSPSSPSPACPPHCYQYDLWNMQIQSRHSCAQRRCYRTQCKLQPQLQSLPFGLVFYPVMPDY